jgi:hypothetical protein
MVEAAAPRKVAIGSIVRFAYRNVFGRLELVPELGWIMLLALLAVSIVPDLVLPVSRAGDELQLDPQDFIEAAVALLALSAFAVRWHQSILLGDPRRQPVAVFFRGWARFLVYGCILYAVLGALVAVTAIGLAQMADSMVFRALILSAALILAWLVLLATARCAMVFPAAACGKPIGVSVAWHLMRDNSWRLIWASLLTALPLKVATLILTAIVIALVAPAGATELANPPIGFVILLGVIEAISDMLLAALGASVLSGFYRELVAWRGDAAPAPAQR